MGIWGSATHSGPFGLDFSLASFPHVSVVDLWRKCAWIEESHTVRLSKIFIDNLVMVQEYLRWENVKWCTITDWVSIFQRRALNCCRMQSICYVWVLKIFQISSKNMSRHAGRKNYPIRRWVICHWSLLKNKLPNVTPMCFYTHSINLFHTQTEVLIS